jgi:hypothetical protein
VEAMKAGGIEGFGLSFKIMAVGTFFGGLISLVLAERTLEFYKSEINIRYRCDEEQTEVA